MSSFLARVLGERQTVGIDIGHYSVKLVRMLHTSKGEHIVMAADLERLDEGVVVDCNIQDGEKLHEAVAKLFARNITDNYPIDLVASINGASGILVDRVTLKVPKGANLESFVLQTAQSRPPFDDPDNMLDFYTVGRTAEEVTAVLVGVKNAQLTSVASFFDSFQKKLTAIDVSCFGLANAYRATVEEEEVEKTVILVNIGEKKANASLIVGGFLHSYRAMTNGALDAIEASLSRNLGIDSAKCHSIFESGDTSIVDGFSEADVEAALQMSYEEVVSAVDFAVRYFSQLEGVEAPSKILLGGGGACLPNLKSYVSEHIGIETDTVNPFRNVPCVSSVVGEEGMSLALSNIYAPALGLAMRKF